MKLNTVLTRTLGLLMVLFVFFSCEDDFLEVGSGIVDESNFTSGNENYPVVAYSERFFDSVGVQTNGLSAGALGFYQDSIYGTTTASTLSQVDLGTYNSTYGTDPVIDSVVFEMPYYSTSSLNSDNETVYELDSVYGTAPIRLTAFRSNYFLNSNSAPDFESGAVYYSNELTELNGVEGDTLFQETFAPSNEPVVTVIEAASEAEDDEITTSSPRLRLRLDQTTYGETYWKEAIIDRSGDDVLFNSNSFRNYFRGVYLKAEAVDNTGSFFLFDKANTTIAIYYTSGAEDSRRQSSITLTFGGNSVVGYENDFKEAIKTELTGIDKENGEENLFLKGGQGSMAVIELFEDVDDDNNGIPDDLDAMRAQQRLIREANLEFFVDQDKIAAYAGNVVSEPQRVYIYNLETNQPLVDLTADATISSSGAITSVGTTHLGPLELDDNGQGVSYKIRITEFLKDLLDPENDDPATKLGLVITQNVLSTSTGAIEGRTDTDTPNRVPYASIIANRGTILYGSNVNVPEAKRLKLKVFYTEASN